MPQLGIDIVIVGQREYESALASVAAQGERAAGRLGSAWGTASDQLLRSIDVMRTMDQQFQQQTVAQTLTQVETAANRLPPKLSQVSTAGSDNAKALTELTGAFGSLIANATGLDPAIMRVVSALGTLATSTGTMSVVLGVVAGAVMLKQSEHLILRGYAVGGLISDLLQQRVRFVDAAGE
jgi:hypothetical protein